LPDKKDDEPEKPLSFTQIFRDQFPYYIHLGMTYQEYWEMDCELVKAYRKAYEYKQEYDNSQAWLQGLYIYAAVNALRPGFVFYGKKAPKPEKYLEHPFAVTQDEQIRRRAEKTKQMAEQFKAEFHRRNQQWSKSEEDK